MKEIRLSIIIPVYNGEAYLHSLFKNLTEVLTSYKNYIELVIVNDGSLDGTKKIIKNFQTETQLNCTFIDQKNNGEGAARNSGIFKSNGTYVLFLDCDDELLSDGIDHFHSHYKENRNFDALLYSYVKIKKNNTKNLRTVNNRVLQGKRKDLYVLNRKVNFGIGSTYLKRSLIENHQLIFGKFKNGADNDFFRKALLQTNSFKEIHKNNFKYILRESSVQTNFQNRLECIAACKETRTYIDSISDLKLKIRYKQAFSYSLIQETFGLFLDAQSNSKRISFWKTIEDSEVIKWCCLNFVDFCGSRQLKRFIVLLFWTFLQIMVFFKPLRKI